MPKIAFIGGGSHDFTTTLVRDILTFPLLENSEIALMDIDEERLKFAVKSCNKIVQMGNYPATVTGTLDRREVLKDADAVLVTILAGSTDVWKHDILIPKKYGIDINVGDTRGPSGIFRALRTIPVMLDICRDMEEICPSAIMLNYTNPMAMLCHAMQKKTSIKVTGLCHSVQGTSEMLAEWIGVPHKEMIYTCAGINHMAWYTKLEHKGKNLYPKLREIVENNKKIYNEEMVRNEMFLAMDYYVSESSGHNSEYNPWFRKRKDLIEKYCTHGTGWNPGEHAYILKEYERRNLSWRKEIQEWIAKDNPIELERGHEYAAYIINAYLGGDIYRFNGNVPNTGLITNLPEDSCVEVPVLVSRKRIEPIHVGDLPAQCALLTSLTAQIENMVVDASFVGDKRAVCQAIMHDPLTAAKLSLREIESMVNDMFEKNKDYLPDFK
ncbi:MAG TPA: alpha-galactosidase [Victivallales bacterium]|nr:alpha-galactosidase [Victivallales bacterium]